MDWSKGFTARYIMTIVDPASWADKEEHEFVSGKITIDTDTTLIQSVSLSSTEMVGDGENYIRLYLLADQDGDTAKVPLFTGLTSTPQWKYDGTRATYTVSAQSVLKPAKDVCLKRGYYVPAMSGAEKIAELLSVCHCPIEVEDNSPLVVHSIVADDGDTNLDMALTLLNAINWRLRILGDGTIRICSPASEISEIFGNSNDVIENTVSVESDWYDCPNVFQAISDENGVAIARDDSDESPYSTVNRGREVWMTETNVELSSSENITEYAERRLKEEQEPQVTVSYTRRFFPEILASDIVRLNYPQIGLDGLYMIESQTLTLGYGCSVKEEVVKVG